MTLNDKVQVGDTTTGTSTATTASQWQTYNHYRAEQGWECPRCGRINAPWKSQCDCGRNNYWTVTDGWIYKPYNDEWWKQVYCDSGHPETITWKAPSSVCSSDSTTSVKSNPNTTTTVWNNEPSTQTIHNGNTNAKEEQKKENTPPRILNKYIKEKK